MRLYHVIATIESDDRDMADSDYTRFIWAPNAEMAVMAWFEDVKKERIEEWIDRADDTLDEIKEYLKQGLPADFEACTPPRPNSVWQIPLLPPVKSNMGAAHIAQWQRASTDRGDLHYIEQEAWKPTYDNSRGVWQGQWISDVSEAIEAVLDERTGKVFDNNYEFDEDLGTFRTSLTPSV